MTGTTMADRSSRGAASAVAILVLLVGAVVGSVIDAAPARASVDVFSEVPVPDIAPPDRNFLMGVSCTSASWCMAVGSHTSDGADSANSAVVWNGTAWSEVTVPAPGSGAELSNVSCSSSSFCVAVGRWSSVSAIEAQAVLWNGSTWSVMSTPTVPQAILTILEDVSCTSPTSCIAVGWFQNTSGKVQTVSMLWDGTAWTSPSTPNVAPEYDILSGISCVTSAWCMAVGRTYDGTDTRMMTMWWNGTAWSIVPSVESSHLPDELFTVSCASSTACTAGGQMAAYDGALIVSWDGTVWSLVAAPGAPSGYVQVYAMSCPSTTFCASVGIAPNDGELHQYIGIANGGTWSRFDYSAGPGLTGGRFNGVSCVSADWCMTVGYWNDNGTPRNYSATLTATPVPPSSTTTTTTTIADDPVVPAFTG